jgi:large subunit ribosomal protein L17
MWHRKRRRRLGVKTGHRKALLRNLVRGLALNRQIETTFARAKEASRMADRMVTIAKEGTLSARRLLIRHLGSADIASVLIEQVAPRLQDRKGGYTRVLKTGARRGDGAEQALLAFTVPIERPSVEKKPKKEKKPKAVQPAAPKEEQKKEEKKEIKREKEKPQMPPSAAKPEKKPEKKLDKEEAEKRGGFLSKLRKFLKGSEE